MMLEPRREQDWEARCEADAKREQELQRYIASNNYNEARKYNPWCPAIPPPDIESSFVVLLTLPISICAFVFTLSPWFVYSFQNSIGYAFNHLSPLLGIIVVILQIIATGVIPVVFFKLLASRRTAYLFSLLLAFWLFSSMKYIGALDGWALAIAIWCFVSGVYLHRTVYQ